MPSVNGYTYLFRIRKLFRVFKVCRDLLTGGIYFNRLLRYFLGDAFQPDNRFLDSAALVVYVIGSFLYSTGDVLQCSQRVQYLLASGGLFFRPVKTYPIASSCSFIAEITISRE